MRTTSLSVAMVIASVVLCAESRAHTPGSGWTWWDGGLPGYARLPLRTGNVPTPPYFALHPPVYYQGVTPRPYGDTPFAYGPANGCRHADQSGRSPAPKRAQVIVNPHTNAAGDERTALPGRPGPMWIINPYYRSEVARPEVATAEISDAP